MLFLSLLISSTMITISALSWFTAWMGLEMNLLSIIPLMKTQNNKFTAEASIKYFIIQTMGSSCLLFSIILLSTINLMKLNLQFTPSLMLNFILFLKMGTAPLHFWLPEVLSGLDWNLVLIILTWQKIAPMVLVSYNMNSYLFLSIIIIISSLVGGVQGMNQICMRKIMAFSSINHMGWMIAALICSMNLWLYYFMIYSLINISIIMLFNKYHMFYINQFSKLFAYNKNLKLMFMCNFFSLGGLPPFIGFLPKWLVINYLVKFNFTSLSTILVILTLMTLYFYTRVCFSSLTLLSDHSHPSILENTQKNFWYFFFNFLILNSLPMCFFLSNIF
uniref:NADH-ubiquinone oxidoreductase chain 2 n=1 Tax=Trigonopterus sp. 5 AH-2016 TaxID=1903839 RepID=A0A343C463_9CUCU|nr:NADH dehydrogenase subunit 2 [Trigonopterus sp. 5 AH-2016]